MRRNQPGIGNRQWRGLNNLLRHEWFGRVWMVQEVVVAKKVHAVYGGAYMDWNEFSDAMSALQSVEMSAVVWSAGETSTIGQTGAPLAISYTSVMTNLRLNYHFGGTITLRDCLLGCVTFDSSDPLDKIFSVQGIVTEKIDERLKVDYNRSVEDLYTDTAEILVDQDYINTVMPLAGIGHQRRFNKLPSWVVDWSSVAEIVQLSGREKEPIYRASGLSTASIHSAGDRGRITIRGFQIDAISKLGPSLLHDSKASEKPSEHVDTIRQIFDFYSEAEELCKSATADNDDNNARDNAFARTIIGDRIFADSKRTAVDPDALATWSRAFHVMTQVVKTVAFDLILEAGNPWTERSDNERFLMNFRIATALAPLGLTQDDFTTYLQRIYKLLPSMGAVCANRMFVRTKRGTMALIPQLARVDDIVFIPLGAQTPFIIRKRAEERDVNTGKMREVYELVGECYVHGVMNGEMMSELVRAEDLLFA
jgi:hypothetical protein